VILAVGHARQVLDAVLLQGTAVGAGDGRREAKHLDDGGAVRTAIPGIPPGDVVGGDARLAVSGPGQGHGRQGSQHRIGHLNHIAHGIDIRVGGAHMLVDADMSLRTEVEPGLAGQVTLGLHADGQHYHVRLDGRAAG